MPCSNLQLLEDITDADKASPRPEYLSEDPIFRELVDALQLAIGYLDLADAHESHAFEIARKAIKKVNNN